MFEYTQANEHRETDNNTTKRTGTTAYFQDRRPHTVFQQQQIQMIQKNRTGMPDKLKTGIESSSDMDMSDVRVHYNSSKPAQLNALAYAQGSNIHIGPGQQKHLPHEAWHVVQQWQGRVKPTMSMNGQSINDDARLEKEASVMGARAMR